MQGVDASTCLPQSPIVRCEEGKLIARAQSVFVGEASNPFPARAQRRRRVSPPSAETECHPTLFDDFARDLEADVTQRESSPRSVISFSLRQARGIFKDVRFYPILCLGPLIFSMFLPHNEFGPFLGPPRF